MLGNRAWLKESGYTPARRSYAPNRDQGSKTVASFYVPTVTTSIAFLDDK